MIFINILTLIFVALAGIIYFKLKTILKKYNYRIKVYIVYYRTALNNAEFVKDLSLGMFAGALLSLVAASNEFVAIVSIVSIIISGLSAIKANYKYEKENKKQK